MNCDDIRQKLKSFLEDLLVEEEYRAFCDHMETCHSCASYVRSIGSLSNQLWKLGQMEVSGDLIPTVQYKLAHPREPDQPVKTKITKKQIVFGMTSIAVAIVLASGIIILKKDRDLLKKKDAVILRTKMIRTLESSGERAAGNESIGD